MTTAVAVALCVFVCMAAPSVGQTQLDLGAGELGAGAAAAAKPPPPRKLSPINPKVRRPEQFSSLGDFEPSAPVDEPPVVKTVEGEQRWGLGDWPAPPPAAAPQPRRYGNSGPDSSSADGGAGDVNAGERGPKIAPIFPKRGESLQAGGDGAGESKLSGGKGTGPDDGSAAGGPGGASQDGEYDEEEYEYSDELPGDFLSGGGAGPGGDGPAGAGAPGGAEDGVAGPGVLFPGAPTPEQAAQMLASLEILKSLSIEKYNHEHFHGTAGGGVDRRGDLDCDGERPCCWQNAQPKTDQLEWATASALFDRNAFQTVFNTDKLPSEKFMFLAALYPEARTYDAKLISCPIRCTDDPVEVTISHWRTAGVALHICAREAFFDTPWRTPITHCTVVPETQTPGPSQVVLPPGEAFEVVIQAVNLTTQHGSFVIVDNIRVDFKPCKDKPVALVQRAVRPPRPDGAASSVRATSGNGNGNGNGGGRGGGGGKASAGSDGGSGAKESSIGTEDLEEIEWEGPNEWDGEGLEDSVCSTEFNECQMICLPDPAIGYRCECEIGYVLDLDGKRCKLDLEFGKDFDEDYDYDVFGRFSRFSRFGRTSA